MAYSEKVMDHFQHPRGRNRHVTHSLGKGGKGKTNQQKR